MNRDFENGYGQDDDRTTSRSRRRDSGGDFGADSGAPASRRPRSGPPGGSGDRPAGQGPRQAPPAGQGPRRVPPSGTPRQRLSAEGANGNRAGSALPDRDRVSRSAGNQEGRRPVKETPPPEKGREPKKHYRGLIITLIILEFLIILPGIFAARQLLKKYNMIQRDSSFNIAKETNPNLNVEKVDNMKGYWTVALFGVDSRDDSVGKGNNADVIIIANVNQENGQIKLVSIFRDSYLSLDDKGSYNKINQAYFLGGPEMAIKALNKNLDIQIDDYATFNWKAVADAINILGGVDVDLTKAEFYYINAYITETVEATGVGSHQLKHAGPNHLDGIQAVAYARLRKMDTDFARTERQRNIIEQCFNKLKAANFSVINNVMEVVFKQILTSITLNDMIPVAKNLSKYTIADTIGFPMQRGDANMGKKGDCVIPETLESNVIALHKFLFDEDNYQPSDMVKKISAKISADTGKYNEGKYIDHVGTNGSYIPKPTESPTKAAEESTKGQGTKESTAKPSESIIDGEYPWDLETDANGNFLDPPEGGYPGAYPGTTQPSDGSRPGAGTSPGTPYPGYTPPSQGDNSGSPYPGASTSPSDVITGPGAGTSPYPGSTKPPAPGYPGGISPTAPAPGYPGTTSPTAPAPGYPGATSPAAPGKPGASNSAVPGNPGSVNPTMSTKPVYPGGNGAGSSPHPGGATEGYVPDGPGSVIIGPGN